MILTRINRAASLRPAPFLAVAFLALAAIFATLSLIAPLNHDESQYFAAAELVAAGYGPFQDFVYLQTPLQPLLLAPLAALSASYSLITLRLTQALAGIATLLLVYLAQRRMGVGRKIALIGAVLLALCQAFQFGTTVVRNDAFPPLFACIGTYLSIAALSGSSQIHSRWLWAGAGLGFGTAIATKISYALPGAAIGLFLIGTYMRDRRWTSAQNAIFCAGGAVAALLPVLFLRSLTPEAFDYGVFHYASHAPFDWYGGNGLGERLTLVAKVRDTAALLLEGPAWAALAALVLSLFLIRDRRSEVVLLDLLIFAGLVAAILPTPTWEQYLIPMLPPLFIRLGILLTNLKNWPSPLRIVMTLSLILGAGIGIVQPVKWTIRAATGEANALTATDEAQWIGARLQAAGAQGPIASLSPHVTLDSNFPVDRRFAAGPFFYRTGDIIASHEQREMDAISPATLTAFLDAQPPAAIVTGYETRHRRFRIDLDAPLRAYALARGYRREESPFGAAELYIAPRSPTARMARNAAQP
ncbi:ArnT family glycosyltransferase [Allosphingosinicella vermicomposti]|uniref:ArnT family glycosyltransferase n=1 Tax=Allosphingosinicella vermicomposti TaxID=614671 RepID=UPI00131A4958|nr:glycosyltransferase family 39 protein [Allosphingosinicella vermicomposti]